MKTVLDLQAEPAILTSSFFTVDFMNTLLECKSDISRCFAFLLWLILLSIWLIRCCLGKWHLTHLVALMCCFFCLQIMPTFGFLWVQVCIVLVISIPCFIPLWILTLLFWFHTVAAAIVDIPVVCWLLDH